MDPITTYQGTTRKITFAITVPTVEPIRNQTTWDELVTAAAKAKADEKFTDASVYKIMAMQYPTYKEEANALSISRPPLVRVSLGGFFGQGTNGGVLAAMEGFTFTPDVGFTAQDSPLVRYGGRRHNAGDGDPLGLAFNKVTMKFVLNVLHEASPGLRDDGVGTGTVAHWLGGSGPYHDFIK